MKQLVYASLESVQAARSGETICGGWWVHDPAKGVAFHQSGRDLFPQCNEDFRVADLVLRRLYPDHELLHIPVAYLGHDDGKSLISQDGAICYANRPEI